MTKQITGHIEGGSEAERQELSNQHSPSLWPVILLSIIEFLYNKHRFVVLLRGNYPLYK